MIPKQVRGSRFEVRGKNLEPRTSNLEPVVVAAGVLYDRHHRVLVARRPDGKHLSGTWEFPGGKLEPGEDAAAALARELHEEVGLDVHASEPLLTLTYRYPEKTVRLLIRTVSDWNGRPEGREGQALRWVEPESLFGLEMPAGNRPIARMLGMSPTLAISPDPSDFSNIEDFLADWDRRAARGHLLQLRAHSLGTKVPSPPATGERTRDGIPEGLLSLRENHPSSIACARERGRGAGERPLPGPPPLAGEGNMLSYSGAGPKLRELATECGRIARKHNTRWLLNGPPDLAQEAGADGVHLPAWRLSRLDKRPLDSDFIVSAACHGPDDIHQAAALALDFVTVSPVCKTASHPERADIGYDGLERICRDSPLPVYALGGMAPDDLARARATGAFGVAGIRAFG